MGIKIVVAALLIAACVGFCTYWNASMQPMLASEQALKQMDFLERGEGDRLANERRLITGTYHWPTNAAIGLTAFLVFGLFISDVVSFVKKGFSMRTMLLLATLCVLFSGCAYDTPVFVEWGSNVTPFLSQLEGDGKSKTVETEALLEKSMLNVRRVQITYRWQPMGRGFNNGKYMPQERLTLVDQSPVTREWTSEASSGTNTKNEAIWVESSDSVGFSTGIAITAKIVDNKDAVKFLFNYPAGKIDQVKIDSEYKDPYEIKRVNLADVMDTEVRARVQKIFSEEAAKEKMDSLRGKKNEIMKAIEKDVTTFFKQRGITITTIGMFGGFKYENPDIQKSIDKVFQAQQDKNVAMAEAEAAKERKESLKLLGEGQAEKRIQEAKGEAEAIKTVAEAKAFELEKLQENPEAYLALKQLELQTSALEIWDGRYPVFLVSGEGNTPNLLLTMPSMKDLPAQKANPNKAKHDAEKAAGTKAVEPAVSAPAPAPATPAPPAPAPAPAVPPTPAAAPPA